MSNLEAAVMNINSTLLDMQRENRRMFDKVDDRMERLESKMERLESRVNTRIDHLEDKVNTRIDRLEAKMDDRFKVTESRMWSQFFWMMGSMAGGMVGLASLIAHTQHWL